MRERSNWIAELSNLITELSYSITEISICERLESAVIHFQHSVI